MLLSGHQPVYLPGIIVFTKMALSDAFMFVGHCDYGDGTWHSHNFIRDVNGTKKPDDPGTRLTIPIQRKSGRSIDGKKMAIGDWRRKQVKTIANAYRRRPYFDTYFEPLRVMIEELYPDQLSLGYFNTRLILLLASWLGIRPDLHHDMGITEHKTDMLIQMCRKVGAGDYLSSPGETYVDQEKMKAAGIVHHFLKFAHPVYDQGAEFVPNLSVIDLLFNCGPESGKIVRGAGYVD